MKSLMLFLQQLLEESGSWCGVSTTRDFETISRRVEHEGLSFLTITLPSFGKDLMKALDNKAVTPTMFVGFDFHRGLPRFLGGFLELVFDRGTGVLLDTSESSDALLSSAPSEGRQIEAIRTILQVTLAFEKMELDTTERRVRKAFEGYIECEQELKGIEHDLVTPEKEIPFVVFLTCYSVTCFPELSVSLAMEACVRSMAPVPQLMRNLAMPSMLRLSGPGGLKKEVFHPWNSFYQVRGIMMSSPTFSYSNPGRNDLLG